MLISSIRTKFMHSAGFQTPLSTKHQALLRKYSSATQCVTASAMSRVESNCKATAATASDITGLSAVDREHERAVARDSAQAAVFGEVRVLPSASSSYQNVNLMHGE